MIDTRANRHDYKFKANSQSFCLAYFLFTLHPILTSSFFLRQSGNWQCKSKFNLKTTIVCGSNLYWIDDCRYSKLFRSILFSLKFTECFMRNVNFFLNSVFPDFLQSVVHIIILVFVELIIYNFYFDFNHIKSYKIHINSK